ncbi:MAG: hypothetical protein QM727_07235 [Niabella sp.]
MRKELLTFEDYFWGLTKDDFKATSDLVKLFMKAYWNEIKLPIEDKTLTPEIDLYIAQHYRETQFLIQFGIWRLQSAFESLLKNTFNIQTKNGLSSILKVLKSKGYKIIKEKELWKWAELRNKLSHRAPEVIHPCPNNLIEQDIEDFSTLLLEIYDDLEKQKVRSSNK